MKHPPREDSEEDTFTTPRHIKLSAEACGDGGRVLWRGRLRGGGSDVFLEGTWVRKNFKAYGPQNPTLPAFCIG